MKLGREIYLLILKPGTLLIQKWAEHPFNKFMKVRVSSLLTLTQLSRNNFNSEIFFFFC